MKHKVAKFLGLLLVATNIVGCDSSNGFSGDQNQQQKDAEIVRYGAESTNDTTVQEYLYEGIDEINYKMVDLIFAMDTSKSMTPELGFLVAHTSNFINQIKQSKPDLDLRVVVLGPKLDVDLPDLVHIDLPVGSYDGLKILQKILDPNSVPTQIRKDAVKEIVVISDDNSNLVSAGEFQDFIAKNKEDLNAVRFNALIGLPKSQQNQWCQIAAPGYVYRDLANLPGLKGVVQDICNSDWSGILGNIGNVNALQNKPILIELNKKITSKSMVKLYVNQHEIDSADWSVDLDRNVITIVETRRLHPGDKILITYQDAKV